MEKLIESIKRHEGYSDVIYLDTERVMTVGWGHSLRPGGKVPIEANELFFKADLAKAVNGFNSIDRARTKHLNEARCRVIVEMIFNLGLAGTMNFKKMWKAIEINDFGEAAAEMLVSRWAEQVKGRAVRLALIMRHGEDLYK